MIFKLIRRLLRSDRIHYLGRNYTFITEGGFEVSGRVIEFTEEDILVDSGERIIRLKRSKIIGETASSHVIRESVPLVAPVIPGYDNVEAQTMPAAVAKPKASAPTTPLEALLTQATSDAEKLSEELGIAEEVQTYKPEKNRYGSILPDDMLLPSEEDDDKTVDLGISFFKNNGD